MTDKKTKRLLYRSRNARKIAANSRYQMISRTVIKQIGDHVTKIGKTGDAKLILETELAILQEERDNLSNAKVQEGSLDTAIEAAKIALGLFEKVRSSESYRTIDEAREFFKSHNSRLLNLNKGILSDEEKTLIEIRRDNIRRAGKIYIAMQKQTLGIAPHQ